MRVTQLNSWYHCGSHFRNKSFLHFHFQDLPKYPELSDLEIIGFHNHTGSHGKTIVDGHFTFVTNAVEKYYILRN